MGFKTQVFKFQFLTRPNISFSRFPNFWPEKGYFLVYFNRPTILAFFQIIYLDTQACIGKQNHWLVHGTFLGFGMVHESNHRFAKIPGCSKSVKSSRYTRVQNDWSGSKIVVTFGLMKILTHPC